MTAFYTLRPLGNLIERLRPVFLSRQEWWFHLSMATVLFPIGCYINSGPRYLTDGLVFLLATLWSGLSYCTIVFVLTLVIRRIMARYARFQQNLQRTIVMILVVNGLASLHMVVQNYFFCAIPFFQKPFNWEDLRQMGIMSIIFVTTLCVLVNLLYAYKQWKREQTAVELLKSETLQHKLDALKQQVNPHFLFNSLSSIFSLVGEDPVQAEQFVDGLAKVYRYMLQANNHPQVPLHNELSFAVTYAHLLRVRYGDSLRIDIPALPPTVQGTLPTLSLQVLIDNALKHNRMSPVQPLVIQLELVDGPGIQVTNSLQRKTRVLDMDRYGLAQLTTRFRALTDFPVLVQQDDKTFSVTLPVLQNINEPVR